MYNASQQDVARRGWVHYRYTNRIRHAIGSNECTKGTPSVQCDPTKMYGEVGTL